MTTRTDAAEIQAFFQGERWHALPLHIQNAISSLIGFGAQAGDDRARAAWMVSELSARRLELAEAMLDQPGKPLELQQAADAADTALIWAVDRLRESDA